MRASENYIKEIALEIQDFLSSRNKIKIEELVKKQLDSTTWTNWLQAVSLFPNDFTVIKLTKKMAEEVDNVDHI